MIGDAKAPPKQRAKQEAKKARIKQRERFRRSHIAEKRFSRQLVAVAKQVGAIVQGLAPDGVVRSLPQLTNALNKYSELLQPWAQSVSQSLVDDVARRDEHAWAETGREIGQALRKEIQTAPTGQAMREMMDEQVMLITSLPLEAAQRVHKLTIEGMTSGTRAKETAAEIMKTGEVTKSRAMLIARTETTRTASAMTMARAQSIGSEGYIWRTARDADVREIHRKLEGKFIKWDEPPVASENGVRAHAGMIYNCRCWMEVVIPDEISDEPKFIGSARHIFRANPLLSRQ